MESAKKLDAASANNQTHLLCAYYIFLRLELERQRVILDARCPSCAVLQFQRQRHNLSLRVDLCVCVCVSLARIQLFPLDR